MAWDLDCLNLFFLFFPSHVLLMFPHFLGRIPNFFPILESCLNGQLSIFSKLIKILICPSVSQIWANITLEKLISFMKTGFEDFLKILFWIWTFYYCFSYTSFVTFYIFTPGKRSSWTNKEEDLVIRKAYNILIFSQNVAH